MSDMRRNDGYQQGPVGGLVRDFAFHASAKRDHFRRVPEAIEDIISAISSRFSIDLTEKYLVNSSSYIVKFTTGNSDMDNLEAATYYLFSMYHNRGLCSFCNTYCTMHGKRVADIVEVEEYEQPPPAIYAT